MKCESTDLQIETIVNRIKNEDMDLQPDFQKRGDLDTSEETKVNRFIIKRLEDTTYSCNT